jgi:hypothetical protein
MSSHHPVCPICSQPWNGDEASFESHVNHCLDSSSSGIHSSLHDLPGDQDYALAIAESDLYEWEDSKGKKRNREGVDRSNELVNRTGWVGEEEESNWRDREIAIGLLREQEAEQERHLNGGGEDDYEADVKTEEEELRIAMNLSRATPSASNPDEDLNRQPPISSSDPVELHYSPPMLVSRIPSHLTPSAVAPSTETLRPTDTCPVCDRQFRELGLVIGNRLDGKVGEEELRKMERHVEECFERGVVDGESQKGDRHSEGLRALDQTSSRLSLDENMTEG